MKEEKRKKRKKKKIRRQFPSKRLWKVWSQTKWPRPSKRQWQIWYQASDYLSVKDYDKLNSRQSYHIPIRGVCDTIKKRSFPSKNRHWPRQSNHLPVKDSDERTVIQEKTEKMCYQIKRTPSNKQNNYDKRYPRQRDCLPVRDTDKCDPWQCDHLPVKDTDKCDAKQSDCLPVKLWPMLSQTKRPSSSKTLANVIPNKATIFQ